MQKNKCIRSKICSLLDATFIKYIIVGGIGYLVEVIILFFLTQILSMWYIYSNIISNFIALIFSYIINNCWTFKYKKIVFKKILILLEIHICNVIVCSSILYFMTSICGIFYLISKMLTTLLSCIWNYFISKHIIYIRGS
ncbi:MAG: GtrA family protein [Clostridiales bacterium]|nr:GtrA family protein [Clostridiales bacterium]